MESNQKVLSLDNQLHNDFVMFNFIAKLDFVTVTIIQGKKLWITSEVLYCLQ